MIIYFRCFRVTQVIRRFQGVQVNVKRDKATEHWRTFLVRQQEQEMNTFNKRDIRDRQIRFVVNFRASCRCFFIQNRRNLRLA